MRTEFDEKTHLLESLKPKPEYISAIEDRLQANDKLGINIGSMEARFLQTLMKLPNVEKVVEIGVLYGCSAAWMAEALGPKGTLYALEIDEECLLESEKTFSNQDVAGFGCNIKLIPGNALESLKTIESEGPFDLVFVDANKSEYLDYYHWARSHLKPGGYLVADNVYLFGAMFQSLGESKQSEKRWTAMRTFLEEVFNDSHFTASFIPTKEGMVFAVKNEH